MADKIYVLAKNYQQFTVADRALRKLSPTGTVIVRIISANQMRGIRRIRVVGLPSWHMSFSYMERQMLVQIAQTNNLSLYKLTTAKYKRLLEEAKQVQQIKDSLINELRAELGGDFSDA